MSCARAQNGNLMAKLHQEYKAGAEVQHSDDDDGKSAFCKFDGDSSDNDDDDGGAVSGQGASVNART